MDYIDEDTAKQQTVITPHITIPLILALAATLLLFALIGRGFIRNRRDEILKTLFVHLWLMQIPLDILFLLGFALVGIPRHFPSTWPTFTEFNETFIPPTVEKFFVFIFVAQVVGIAFLAVERFFGTFDVLSFLHELLERIPRPFYFILKLAIPAIVFIPFLDSDPPFYFYDDSQGAVALFTMHHGHIQSHWVGPIVIVSTIVSAFCFAAIGLRGLVSINRHRKLKLRMEIEDDERMTAMAFLLFLAQLVAAVFCVFARRAKLEEDLDSALWLRARFVFVQYLLSTVGPWSLLLARRSRGLIFRLTSLPASVSTTSSVVDKSSSAGLTANGLSTPSV